MTIAQRVQWALASVFFVLGGWALAAPQTVIALAFAPAVRSGGRIAPFAVACFGSQAVLSGVFAAFSRFTRTTFLAYAVALTPFLAFDVWFTAADPVLSPDGGLLDAAGNLVMLALCGLGWRSLAPPSAG